MLLVIVYLISSVDGDVNGFRVENIVVSNVVVKKREIFVIVIMLVVKSFSYPMNYLVYLSLLVDRSMLVRVVPQVFLKVDLKNVEVVFINHIYIVGVSVGNDKAKGDKLKEVFEKIIIVVEDSNC